MFIISEGSKSRNIFDTPDGSRSRETVRTKLGSFTVEEGAPQIERWQSAISGQREKGPHSFGDHGQKHLRRKHKRKDKELSDRRKRVSDEYFVV